MNEEHEEQDEDPLSQILRAYDFSLLAAYPDMIKQALSQIKVEVRMGELQEAVRQQGKMYDAFRKAQMDAMRPLEELKKAQAAIADLGRGFAVYTEKMKAMMGGLKLPKIEFPRSDREYVLDPLNQLAVEYGWPPLYHFPLGEPRHLFEEASKIENEEERQRFIDEQITLFYRDELDSILENWEAQSFLAGTERLEIIKDGFEAHKQGKYSLSSPVMLAQTEGIFIDFIEVGRKKPVGSGQYRTQVQKLRKRRGDKSIVYGLAEILLAFVEHHGLFGKQASTNPITEEISRHAILHGRTTAYCKREDISLRHIIWMDNVITLTNHLKPAEDSDTESSP